PSNNNCEVTHIDGLQAFQVIYEFARDFVFISRDIGVRFNSALDLVDVENSFSYRIDLPPTSNITYRLNCSNSVREVNRIWIAMNVTEEYKGDHYTWQPTDVTLISVVQDFISFYKKDDFGVIKIFTEQVTFNDTVAINTIKGFEDLVNTGVKKYENNKIDDFIGNNSYTRGNVTSYYSNKFVPNILSLLSSFIAQYLRTPIPWTSNDLIILTNGICGSACALIAKHAVENNNVTSVAVGGFVNTSLSYSSFPGGFFSDSSAIFKISSLNNTLIPNPFPLAAFITFPYTEVYSKTQPDQLLEFLFTPAKFRLYYNDQSIYDPSILWSDAAALIGK
ncbi:6859_t:CDS:2, partial [Racocetra fulgida]